MKKVTKPKSKYDKVIQRRGVWLLLSAAFLAEGSLILGIVSAPALTTSVYDLCKIILPICCVLPILAFPLNAFLCRKYVKKLDEMKVAEAQQYFFRHRELAEEMSIKKLAFIKRCRIFTDLYAGSFSIFAFGIAFCAGVLFEVDLAMVFFFVSLFFFLSSITNIRFKTPEVIFEEDKTYVSADDYPELYALAQKAADTLNCKGKINIALLDNFNAGIAKIGDVYSVQLGAILLNLLSQKELYSVLLHEFAHIANDNVNAAKEHNHCHWIDSGKNPHFLSNLVSLLYAFSDMLYMMHYHLYQYASSVLIETAADQMMSDRGNAEYAASALLKTKYYELYDWEKGTYDTACYFAPEKQCDTTVHEEIELFKKAIDSRAKDWNILIDSEILSRSASHPTIKMRLNTLGIDNYGLYESDDTDQYKAECEKAVRYVDELICRENSELYKENRKTLYLEPLQMVHDWEEVGRPLIPEEYADIDIALRHLGRVLEANQLCDRAITELNGAASCYAHFMKGCFLLHSYEESGIDHLYHAIENNSNYIDEGLEVIGEYCCLTGKQDELETYRAKAIELSQKQKDVYSELSILNKNDHLTAESLPEGMLEDILTYIHSIEDNCIQNIYLVRKTISNDFFTSAFVIRFVDKTAPDKQDQVLHKIFSYLDTCSDWQFSLFNYANVKNAKVDKIDKSCVYAK